MLPAFEPVLVILDTSFEVVALIENYSSTLIFENGEDHLVAMDLSEP